MNKDFLLWKKQALEKLDKSHIGGIDKHIQSLCDTINKKENFFTLSSCSGRICVIGKSSKGKEENCWVYVSHEISNSGEIITILNNYSDEKKLEFRQESAIIHICCENVSLAKKIMHLGKLAGFNQVGIIAITNKIVVELICEAEIVVPVYDSKLLVDNNFLEYLVKNANENLEYSWRCIDKLNEEIGILK